MRDGHQVARCAALSVPVTDLREAPMKTAEDVDEMLRLGACGWGAKRIGRHLGCSHHTVKRYLEAGGAVAFRPPARVRALDGHEDWLRERFLRHRGNADVVRQELIAEKDVLVSLRTVERAVTSWRQALKAEALATVRFETPPGRQLQIDFGERFAEIAGERVKVFLFVATPGYSRRVHVRAFRGERQENWLTGLESAFTTFGSVPEEVLIDNPRALVTTHDATTRQVTFNPTFLAFARHWGFVPRACAPCRARTKGKTESGVGHVKKNAVAGRSFQSWDAFGAHLAAWEREVANMRVHGTTQEAPLARFARDEAHRLKPLGGRPAFGALRDLVRVVSHDCAITLDANSYSVPWRLIERLEARGAFFRS
ncbi:IS21 family transposase, partial [Cereibacter sphaeroides]|uniref:IS21 family transposase n=1 Tax=Cereibacter sphaeroides TaxID=1063 RepID=UPI003AF1B0D2